jgi:cytochrome subunit of sulfide dehydrogenase
VKESPVSRPLHFQRPGDRARPPAASTLPARALWALLLMAASAQAQTAPQERRLAPNCFQCHGTHGRSLGLENVAGKSVAEIYRKLLEVRNGQEGAGVIGKHAMGYSDAQLKALSQFLFAQR